jgi:hypothetical protein
MLNMASIFYEKGPIFHPYVPVPKEFIEVYFNAPATRWEFLSA